MKDLVLILLIFNILFFVINILILWKSKSIMRQASRHINQTSALLESVKKDLAQMETVRDYMNSHSPKSFEE